MKEIANVKLQIWYKGDTYPTTLYIAGEHPYPNTIESIRFHVSWQPTLDASLENMEFNYQRVKP